LQFEYTVEEVNGKKEELKMEATSKVLFETDTLLIGHSFEKAFMIIKESGLTIFSDFFYGDPSCGLIDKHNRWAIIAGDHITVWKDGNLLKFSQEQIPWVHSLRETESNIVEFLVDPFSSMSSIWEIDIDTLKLVS
jgi:hypothetical protein